MTSSVIYYSTDARKIEIYLLNKFYPAYVRDLGNLWKFENTREIKP